MTHRGLQRAVFAATLLCAVSLLVSALVLRPVFWDGSWFMLRVIHAEQPFRDPRYYRYLNELLQWPGLLVLSAWPGGDAVRPATLALSLAYSLHPIASLAACAAYLRRCGKPELLVFPVLSFAVAVMPTLPYAVGTVTDSISVFWPLFLFVAVGSARLGATGWATVLALSCALALGYEPGMVLFAPLGLAALLHPERSRPQKLALLLVFTLGGAFLAARAFGPWAGPKDQFQRSLEMGVGPLRLFGLVTALCLGAPLVVARWETWNGRRIDTLPWAQALLGIAVIAVPIGLVPMVLPDWDHFLETHSARLTAAPLAGAIAFAALPVVGGPAFAAWRSSTHHRFMLAGTIVALLAAAWHDVVLTGHWLEARRMTEARLSRSEGCVAIPFDRFQQRWNPRGLPRGNMPHVSILLAGERAVGSILVVHEQGQPEPCHVDAKGRSRLAPEHLPVPPAGYLDVSAIVAVAPTP